MAERDSGKLLGYLLGALDDAERREIDERLPHEPKLRRQLARAKAKLQRLRAGRREHEPPRGLVQRTCRLVALFSRPTAAHLPDRRQTPDRRDKEDRPRAARMSPATVPPSSTAGWRWADIAVAATVLVFASLAILSAIQTARSRARLAFCQDNLRQLGVHFVDFDQSHRAASSASSRPASPRGVAAAQPPMPLPSAGISAGHQGINSAAFGPNVLFGDGHVAFVCTAMWAPEPGDLPSSDAALCPPRTAPTHPFGAFVTRTGR